MAPLSATGSRWQRWVSRLTPGRIALVYVVFGMGLLVISDMLVPELLAGSGYVVEIQAIKGGLEVLVSGLLIFGLVRGSQQALRERQARYEGVLEYFPNGGVVRFDEDLRFVDVGGADLEELGLRSTEMEGQTPADVFPPDLAEAFETNGSAALDGEERTFEITWQGRTYHVQTAPLRDPDGDVVAGIAVSQNITQRTEREQKLEQREQTYRNLVENSPAPINLFDEDGEIVWGNRALLDMLGLDDHDELVGRSIFDFIHPEDHDQASAEIDDVLEGDDDIVGPTEFRILRDDGERRHIRVNTTAGWYEGERVGQAVVNDVTALRETEERLRENERRYRTLVEMSPDPILVHTDGKIVFANEAMADLVEAPDVESLVGDRIIDYLDPTEHEDALEMARETQRGETRPTRHERTLITAAGNTRQIETTSRAIGYEETPAVLTIIKDVTDRYHHEHTLRTLHLRTQEMTRATGEAQIGEIAVQTTDELLDLDGTIFFEFAGEDLEPLAWTEGVLERLEDSQLTRLREELVWEVFVDGDSRYVGSVEGSEQGAAASEVGIGVFKTAFVVPVGNHGVLLAGSTDPLEFSSAQQDVVYLIAENLAAALDRAATESALRERDRRLQRRNESLEQVNRLNEIIRDINQTLVRSATGSGIKDAACEHFAADDKYAFAWICEDPTGESGPNSAYSSGLDAEYADFLEEQGSETAILDLVDEAVRDGAVHVARNVIDDPAWADDRGDALRYGYRSVAVVPIIVRDHVESALVIHGTDADLFDDRERTVLEELGRTIGYALRNVKRVQAVQSEDRVEVDVAIEDSRLVTTRAVSDLDASVEFVGAVPGSDDRLRAFLRIEGTDEPVVKDRLEGLESVQAVRGLSNGSGPGLYQLSLAAPPLVEIVQRNDARIRELTAADGVTTVTAVLEGDTDVRTLIEDLTGAYPDTTLVARRSNAEPVETRETFRDRLLEELTEKQRDALRTAYFGGFFEWPRVSTSEELAETRGIAASTFQHHLRAAERKVFGAVLEPG